MAELIWKWKTLLTAAEKAMDVKFWDNSLSTSLLREPPFILKCIYFCQSNQEILFTTSDSKRKSSKEFDLTRNFTAKLRKFKQNFHQKNYNVENIYINVFDVNESDINQPILFRTFKNIYPSKIENFHISNTFLWI